MLPPYFCYLIDAAYGINVRFDIRSINIKRQADHTVTARPTFRPTS
jgi:hypothetical protein